MKTKSIQQGSIFLYLIFLFTLMFNTTASAGLPRSSPLLSDQQLIANLMITSGNTETLADGMRIRFNSGYLCSVVDDVIKLNNPGENICSWRENKELIIERRPWMIQHDTIFLRMTHLSQATYRVKFNTISFSQANMIAWVEDAWMGSSFPVAVNGDTSRLDFKVTSDPASSASDRFRIIFTEVTSLPLAFTSLKAYQQSGNVAVEWEVSNQVNIMKYEVEHSIDGIDFSRVATKAAAGINGGDETYEWLDINPTAGNNFYRIRSIGISGEIKYSDIIKINTGRQDASVSVYPNPVVGKMINMQFAGMVKGNYAIRLINNIGQVVLTKVVFHSGGSATISIQIGDIEKGKYYLQIVQPGKDKTVRPLFIR